MTCECCQAARETAGLWNQFTPLCLWCGARLIQRIGKLAIAQSESVERRRTVLADWMKAGHPEDELRRLAGLKGLPLAPLPSCDRQRKAGG